MCVMLRFTDIQCRQKVFGDLWNTQKCLSFIASETIYKIKWNDINI